MAAPAPPPPPPAAPKPVEAAIPPPPPPAKPVESPSPTVLALADDPTIKSLTAKLNDNPDDAAALYRRGQVYASKGAYELAIKDFNNSLRLNPKDCVLYTSDAADE